MLIKSYKIRVVTLLVSTLLFSQCITAINSSGSEILAPASVIVKKQQKSLYTQSISTYLVHANQQEENEKQKSGVIAADNIIAPRHGDPGMGILAQTGDAPIFATARIYSASTTALRDKNLDDLMHQIARILKSGQVRQGLVYSLGEKV